jgi:hypothetical protein
MYNDDYWRQEQIRQDQLRQQIQQDQLRQQIQQDQLRQQIQQNQLRQDQLRQDQLRADRRREDILKDLRQEDEQRERNEERRRQIRKEDEKQSEEMQKAILNMIWKKQLSSSKQSASTVNLPLKGDNIVHPNNLQPTNRNNPIFQQKDSFQSILLKTAAGVAGAIALGWGLKWLADHEQADHEQADHEQTDATTEANKGDLTFRR